MTAIAARAVVDRFALPVLPDQEAGRRDTAGAVRGRAGSGARQIARGGAVARRGHRGGAAGDAVHAFRATHPAFVALADVPALVSAEATGAAGVRERMRGGIAAVLAALAPGLPAPEAGCAR